MNFSLYIAKRYLLSKSRNNAINIISIIAALGVVVSTTALFVVLSGFSGLKNYSLSFFYAAYPDIKITASKGKTFVFTDSLKKQLNRDKAILAYSKILEERALFHYRNKRHIAYIKGVDIHYTDVVRMDTAIIAGKWLNPDLPYGVVVGNHIANKLSIGIDFLDPLTIYVPKPGNTYDITPSNLIYNISTQSTGIFAIVDEIDSRYVFTLLPIAQELLNYPLDRISGISVRLDKETDADEFSFEMQQKLGKKYKVQTRSQLNSVFYKMLNTENLMLYFIFTLVIIIALFNVIGAIIMMILDKKKNLKTLLSMGVNVKDLKKIFVYQGFLLNLFGLIIGLTVGVILIYLQDQFKLFMINDILAYPVVLKFKNLLIVVVTMVVLGYLAAKVASSRINRRFLE